jgi:hypothetical protein
LGLTGDDLEHLLADLTDLGSLSIVGLLQLVLSSLGEADDEDTEEVAVSGLDIDATLNERLPLADEALELVGSEAETVEVGQAVLALNVVNSEAELEVGLVLILEQVSSVGLKNTALELLSSDL